MEILDLAKIDKITYGLETNNIDITKKIIDHLSSNGIITDSKNIHSIIGFDPFIGIPKVFTIYLNDGTIIKIDEYAERIKRALVTINLVNLIEEKLSFNKESEIVITFTDKKYLPVFNIFFEYYSKLNLSNLLVVTLDQDAYDELLKKSIHVMLIKYNSETDGNFWRFRSNIINLVFKTGKKDLIHTDSDCIWLKNIIPVLNIKGYEIIGQIEHGHPFHISGEYGFIMCCGFYKMSYTEKTISLIDKIMEQMIDDDQVALNEYVFKNKDSLLDHDKLNVIRKEIILHDSCRVGFINELVTTREVSMNVRNEKSIELVRICDDNTYCFHPWLYHTDILDKAKYLLEKIQLASQTKRDDNLIYLN
jgi:hypothetical protein